MSIGSCAPSCATSSTESRSRSACKVALRAVYALCLSAQPSACIRSWSQLLVFCSVVSNTSRPVALIASSPSACPAARRPHAGSCLKRGVYLHILRFSVLSRTKPSPVHRPPPPVATAHPHTTRTQAKRAAPRRVFGQRHTLRVIRCSVNFNGMVSSWRGVHVIASSHLLTGLPPPRSLVSLSGKEAHAPLNTFDCCDLPVLAGPNRDRHLWESGKLPQLWLAGWSLARAVPHGDTRLSLVSAGLLVSGRFCWGSRRNS